MTHYLLAYLPADVIYADKYVYLTNNIIFLPPEISLIKKEINLHYFSPVQCQ